MGHAARHQQTENPDEVVPEGVEEGGVAIWGTFPTKHLHEIVEKDKHWEEVCPEVACFIGWPER